MEVVVRALVWSAAGIANMALWSAISWSLFGPIVAIAHIVFCFWSYGMLVYQAQHVMPEYKNEQWYIDMMARDLPADRVVSFLLCSFGAASVVAALIGTERKWMI